MKHIMVALISLYILHTSLQAQNWLTTGNKGLTTSNFLGTTDSKDLVFKAKNIERGRLQNKTGTWRFGSTVNNASIDSAGNLRFSGNAAYRIGENKYAILCDDMPQEGLFMNDDLTRWEFRDDKAFPFFTINNSTYDIATKGGLQVGNNNNNASIDSAGNLRFSGNAAYRIGENKYALLCNEMPQEGLFMNDDLTRWEFRDDKAFPFFTINNSTYDIATKGGLQVGNNNNNASIDSAGNLRFSGNAAYRIGENKYALLCNDMPQEGLFMNDDSTRWEFRDDKAFPFFTINNSTYDIATKGGLQVGNSATAAAGNIRFNAGIFQGFDGKSWKDFRLVTATQLLSDTGLQTVNDREQKQINDLQQEINELKAVIQAMQKNSAGYNPCAASSSSNNGIAGGVSLQQNTPNPFYQSTVIKYSLPARFSSAGIIITNSSGNTVIQHNVSAQEQGSFTLNAGTLASGTYHYALVIDGNIVSTKTMVLNK